MTVDILELQFVDWKAFTKEITNQFGLLTSQQEAIDTIQLLEQDNMTCEEYATVFQTYMI